MDSDQRTLPAGVTAMESISGGERRRLLLVGAAAALLSLAPWPRAAGAASPLADRPSPSAASKPRDASIDEYRQHLAALAAVVDACAKAREEKTCDPAQVGPDDTVPLARADGSANGARGTKRLIRYGWLRVLLSEAQEKDAVVPEEKKGSRADSAGPPKPTVTQLLQAAAVRLDGELFQTGRPAAAPPAHNAERAVMTQVLSGRAFRGLNAESARQSALEKFGEWLNSLFEGASRLTAKSAWLGRLAVWGFVTAVCVGLIWGLMRFERNWRVRLTPQLDPPAAAAVSARHWQLWLEDARRASEEREWRKAIHFAYWAAISGLESRRVWPADRARTPREYLSLLAPQDGRRPPLAALTRSFEHVWYGGHAAGEAEYLKAEELANALISGGARPAHVTPELSSAIGKGAAE